MLNLFTRIASSWSAKPHTKLKTLAPSDSPFTLVESSECYHRELQLPHQVTIRLSSEDPERRLYALSQLQIFLVNGQNIHYVTELGSLDVFFGSHQIWLRTNNKMFELSMQDLNHLINVLENTNDNLKIDFAYELLKKVKRSPRS